MAFGAKFARAAEDDQAAYALAQQAQEMNEPAGTPPVAQRPAAPLAAPVATAAPAASTPRFQRPAPAAAAPVTPVAASPVPAAVTPSPVATPSAAPITPTNAGPRRFTRPSQMAQAPVEAPVPAPAPVAAAPAPVAAAPVSEATPVTPSAPVAPAEGRPRFGFNRGPSAPVSTVPQELPPVAAAPTRPRPAFGRPATASAPAAPRAGGFRPGGFRANGMGEAPVRPTGEDDDLPGHTPSAPVAQSAPASSTAVPSSRPARPAVPASSGGVPAAFTPRAGGFRGTGAGAAPARPTGEEDELRSSGRSVRRGDPEAPRLSASGLPVRLDRLIDVVCEHLGKTPDEVAQVKKQALQEQDAVTREFDRIFKEEVEPQQQQNAQRFDTLKQAMETYPGKVVFMHVKDGKQHLVGIDRSKAGAKAMYEGQLVETIDASRTMFAPPSVLFAAPAEPTVVATDDAAFDEPSDAPAAVARGPRP